MTDKRCSRSRSASDRRECERVKGHAKRRRIRERGSSPSMAGVTSELATALAKKLATRRHELPTV